ncbi:transcription initiation factor IIE subunit alpha [Trichomonascus vanleenenianus]|uniref:transcription initiation factor IIE subunit alpha n=1 Tax=Trichomonascus vanleenenianus TaxID=2268995 RepID=UPI003ECAA2AE
METVKTLIRMVTRGFYDLRSILIMDALLVHSALSDDDMVQLLGIQRKDLRALCQKLKEDHLLADHVQKEEGITQRPLSKTYYYVHFTEAVDAIKWKMQSIVTALKEQMGAESQPQGYVCPVCHKRFTTIDAAQLFNGSSGEFLCDQCNQGILVEDSSGSENQHNQDRLRKLMTQIQPIIDTLMKIDEMQIPENTFQSSMEVALPPPQNGGVPGAQQAQQVRQANQLPSARARPGDANIQNGAQFKVSITSEQETAEQERMAKEEKARKLAENALPSWYQESTVGKSLNDSVEPVVKTEVKTEETKPAVEAIGGTEETSEDKANEDALAAYYAQLAEQEAEEDEDEDEEEDEEDEEDEEFEEVEITPATTTAEVQEEDFDEED